MADFSLNLFQPNLSLSDVNDRLIAMQRSQNYHMRHLDSLNVKTLNTEITIIKSEGGEMDLTGRNIKMYDETSRLRFRVGLSTSSIYDLTLWSSNTVSTDYDYSSNASLYINSSGEAVFADKIYTKKDAVVGDNLYVGYNYSSDVTRAIRLKARQQTTAGSTLYSGNVDLTFRSWFYYNYQIAEIGSLPSSTPSNSSVMYQNYYMYNNCLGYEQVGNFFTFTYSTARIQQAGKLEIAAFNGTVNGAVDIYAQQWVNINNFVNATGVIMHPNAYLESAVSSNLIATVGFGNDNYCLNNSTDRKITWDYDSVNVNGEMYVNTVLQVRPIDKAKTVQNESTDRKLSLDFTTHGAMKVFQNSTIACSLAQCINSTRVVQFDFTTANDNLNVYRNSTKIAGAVMAKTSAAVKLDWVTASSYLDVDVNGVNYAKVFDKTKTAQNESTDRQVSFDFTTGSNNLIVGRNSTMLKSVVLSDTTDAVKLNWSTANSLPSIVYNSTLLAYLARSAGSAHRFEWNVGSSYLGLQVAGSPVADILDKADVTRNVSTDRRLSLDFTTGSALKVFQNSTLCCSLVQGFNSTRVLNLDLTPTHDNLNVYLNSTFHRSGVLTNSSDSLHLNPVAMGSGQMINIVRQSSQIAQPVMDYTTGLNVQMHIRRLATTELYFPTTGVWLVFYSSGTYMGKKLLDA